MSKVFSENPLVTVVIATYNRSLLVMEAIASVSAQTYTRWELIVADDGSDDDTVERIRTMSDPRIRVLALPHSGNIATVRNAGAAAGSGEWIAFLDSDDLWIPQKLEIQVDLLKKENKRWIYGGYELIDSAGQIVPVKAGIYRPFSGWIAKELLSTEASVNMGTLMIERTLFNELEGFDTEPLINYREDYEFVLRLAIKAETVASPERIMRIREHQGRVTNSSDKGNERTAAVYRHFLKTHSAGKTTHPAGTTIHFSGTTIHSAAPPIEKELLRIAKRQLAFHLAETAVRNMKKGSYALATRQLGQALLNGDRWRHWLSALRRGFRGGEN
jgi:glycosyltransferase involved in cell wall biosynthesis